MSDDCRTCGTAVGETDEFGQCRVCAHPGMYSSRIKQPGTSKNEETKQKENHVW